MHLRMDSKHRLTFPAKLAPTTPGEYYEVLYVEDEDKFIVTRVKRKKSWLQVLKECPVPMDDLPPRSRELPKKLKL